MADNDPEGASNHDVVQATFSSDEDREQLKQAILECTRTEVARALNGILGGLGHSVDSISKNQPEADTINGSLPEPPQRKRRPQTVQVGQPQRPNLNVGRRPKTSQPKSSDDEGAPESLPLEPLESQSGHALIDRSSFNLLQRSSAIVTKATGEPPKKYNDVFREDDNCELPEREFIPPENESSEAIENESGAINTDTAFDELQRVESWPDSFRPTTAARLIHTSHSVLRNKPSKRRPLTTTALERRKPPPSTAASERSKAQEISKRLLGPITLEPNRPNYDFVVPNSLAADEWENELARNIINVFSNKARAEIREEEPTSSDEARAPSATAATTSLFSNESAFHGGDFAREEEGGGDFQRISICANPADAEFCADASPKKEVVPKAKTAGKKELRGGTFRLKMIWFTGTGIVRANWEVINEVDKDGSIDCDELSLLEEQGRYMRYTGMVESSILHWNSKTMHEDEHRELKQELWRQLIITCNYFATKLIEKRKYSKAMEMLEKTVGFIGSEMGFLQEHICQELTAMVKDTYAYYYIRRSKPSASYQYLISAINIYKRRSDALNVAKCRLHQSFIQCAQHKYSDSMGSLRRILTMLENGALDVEADYNQVLLLASVAYHNIAVQQLMLGHISDACVSSQNARRLARLCLSVSSHFLPMLESTHKQSLNELSSVLKNSHCEEQASLFRNLISELFE